jgi:hypothetical protein
MEFRRFGNLIFKAPATDPYSCHGIMTCQVPYKVGLTRKKLNEELFRFLEAARSSCKEKKRKKLYKPCIH